MTGEISALREIYVQQEAEIKRFNVDIVPNDRQIQSLGFKITTLEKELNGKTSELKSKCAEVHQLKSSGLYQRTLRRAKEPGEKSKGD